MTIDTKTLRKKAAGSIQKDILRNCLLDAADALDARAAEIARLQHTIDSRPAINAGLPETYITWSQSIYAMEAAHAKEAKQ